MTENDDNTKIIEEKKVEAKDGGIVTTTRKSVVQVNPDGTTTVTDSIISSTLKNEIKLDENTKVNVSEVDAELEDKKYIDAIRFKNQLGILKDANNLICMIPLKAAELILQKMGGSLEADFSLFAFGIYSLEEINELRKSSVAHTLQNKKKNFTKDFDIYMEPLERLNKNKNNHYLDSTIFQKIQERLDWMKAEEERKRREEEEQKRKIEEENRLKS